MTSAYELRKWMRGLGAKKSQEKAEQVKELLSTVYNRFNRWSRKRFWTQLVEALARSGAVTKSTSIDSTYVKAHRSAHGGKGGLKIRLSGPRAVVKPPKSTSSRT